MLDLVLGELNLLPGPGRSDFQEASDNIVENDVIHPRRRCHSTAVIQITARERERERETKMKESAATFSNGAELPSLYHLFLGLPKRRRFIQYLAVTGMVYGTLFWLIVHLRGFFPICRFLFPKTPLWLNKIRKYRFKS